MLLGAAVLIPLGSGSAAEMGGAATVPPLVANGGFEAALAGWHGGTALDVDRTVVYDGTASLRVHSEVFAESCGPVQYVDLKPNTRYAVSFAVKVQDLVPNAKDRYYRYGSCGAFLRFRGGVGVNQFLPGRCLTGTQRWDLYACSVETAAGLAPPQRCYLQPAIRQATGTAWFDCITVRELPARPGSGAP